MMGEGETDMDNLFLPGNPDDHPHVGAS